MGQNRLSYVKFNFSKAKNFIFEISYFFYLILLKPKSQNIDIKRKELILNILLVCVLFLSIVGIFLVIYSQLLQQLNYHGTSLISTMSIFLFIVLLLFISRKGYIQIPSYLLIFLLFSFSTYNGYLWGVDLPSNLLSYALLVVISSILINARFGFFIMLFIGIIIITFSYLEMINLYIPLRTWQNENFLIDDAIEYVAIILIITTVSWLSNRETEKSLLRAQESENELQQEKDLLEIKIIERTNELRQAQIDKMAEIYRFVEFGRLSSGLFHDLMTPLTSISIALEKFSDSNLFKNEIIGQTTLALKSSRRMNELLIHAKKHINIPDMQSNFHLADEVQTVIDFLSSKWKKVCVDIILRCPGHIILFGNPVMFNHIVTNLISNAIDSYEDNFNKNTKEIHIDISENENKITLNVRDFGCGIQTQIIPSIFEPFFTTKDSSKGTGLGLSATKHTVEKYFNGNITVQSKLEIGTVFSVIFPKNSTLL